MLATYTMATPKMTVATETTMGAVKVRFNQKSSTMHTNGMIKSFAICNASTQRVRDLAKLMLSAVMRLGHDPNSANMLSASCCDGG